MPRLNTSSKVAERIQLLLERLLSAANNELADDITVPDSLKVSWQEDASTENLLIVETELKFLIDFAWGKVSTPTLKDQLRNDLRVLKEFMNILEDTRARSQGSKRWRFALRLWDKGTTANLEAFKEAWTGLKKDRRKRSTPETADS